MTEQEGTRNAERTRRAVLDAAVDVLAERGTAATVQHIATAAGLSKGGLLHHFPDRDALLYAVAEDHLERFRLRVLDRVDLSENRPGKVLRAYVRALCGSDTSLLAEYGTFSGIWPALEKVPGVQTLSDEDNDSWFKLFEQDGLDPDRILVVRYATEGLAIAHSYDANVSTRVLERARKVLLGLIDEAAD
ncbi:TetR/AcrR family transcriptional regulator [Arthrobacter sp. Sa2BUA2]|uniref:TetR/AcrR family transcriptional regulator n=1 Tax=Arthrobacter pullicola TaxID=2762224 RepID=A0ABR8YL28_9MICC|nr:TetR/AcrR family transcriptional regulator [Arthrobacter pullicola]MBD8044942.1 TetR/AcrR family transcriptional regulator [Arthrobacter pullicola]